MFNVSCNVVKVLIEWLKGFNNSIDFKSVYSVILRLKCIYNYYFFIYNSNIWWSEFECILNIDW